MHKLSDLRERDVINIYDGRRLGVIYDIDVDHETGKILSIICPGPGRFLGIFGGGRDCVIPWDRVVRIGPDVILVDLPNHGGPRERKSGDADDGGRRRPDPFDDLAGGPPPPFLASAPPGPPPSGGGPPGMPPGPPPGMPPGVPMGAPPGGPPKLPPGFEGLQFGGGVGPFGQARPQPAMPPGFAPFGMPAGIAPALPMPPLMPAPGPMHMPFPPHPPGRFTAL